MIKIYNTKKYVRGIGLMLIIFGICGIVAPISTGMILCVEGIVLIILSFIKLKKMKGGSKK